MATKDVTITVPPEHEWHYRMLDLQLRELQRIKGWLEFMGVVLIIMLLVAGCNAIFGGL